MISMYVEPLAYQASALSGAHVKEAFDILFEEVPQLRNGGTSSQGSRTEKKIITGTKFLKYRVELQ